MPPKFSPNITKQRLRDVVNHYERSPSTTAPKPIQPDGGVLPSQNEKIDLTGRVERFLLTEDISSGKLGFGLRLSRVPDPTFVAPTEDSDGNEVTEESPLAYRWLVTRQEEMLCAQGGLTNAYPKDCVVSAIYYENCWLIIGGELAFKASTAFLEDAKPFSIMTYTALSDGSVTLAPVGYTPWDLDAVTDSEGNTYQQPWNASYFATGGDPFQILEDHPDMWAEQGAFEDGESIPHRLCGAPLLGQPVKVRYTAFDGTIDNSEGELPEELQDWIIARCGGDDGAPSPGELFWGPATDGSLKPRIVALPLYWWSYETPDYVIVTRKVMDDNPDYEGPFDDTANPYYDTCVFQQVWDEATQDYINHPDYDPDNIVCQSQIEVEKSFWATPGDCFDDGVPVSTGIESTEDPPEARYAYWVAMNGYWGFGGGWDYGWYANRWWRYTRVGWPSYHTSWYWGAGYSTGGYWWSHYTSYPPTRTTLNLPSSDETPPDPPCGQVQKRHLYGYAVWNWGWEVVSVNTEEKTCFIAGPIRTRVDTVVVDNVPPQEIE